MDSSCLCCSLGCRLRLKCDGIRAETRFRLSAKRTSPFKSTGTSVQSTTCSRGVRISGSNAGYTMFTGSVKGTDYPLHSAVSPSLPLPHVTVCHHISTGPYRRNLDKERNFWLWSLALLFRTVEGRSCNPSPVIPPDTVVVFPQVLQMCWPKSLHPHLTHSPGHALFNDIYGT